MINESSEIALWRSIVNSYLAGRTALPPYLGLSCQDYQTLCRRLGIDDAHETEHFSAHRQLRLELSRLRIEEHRDLTSLLFPYRHQHTFSDYITPVLCHACLGSQHLWQDLGLQERAQLSQLFSYYYPELSQRNHNNMRWKRFLYRQLCASGGDYICRAPSCDTCPSTDECFYH